MKDTTPEILRGFKKHRPGRIHLLCDMCGRKMSNMPRGEHDPKRAVLLVYPCDKHPEVNQPDSDYYDDKGEWIDWAKEMDNG